MRAQLHHLPAELGLAAISIGKSYADWREPGRAFRMRRYNSNRFQRKVASGWLFPGSSSFLPLTRPASRDSELPKSGHRT